MGLVKPELDGLKDVLAVYSCNAQLRARAWREAHAVLAALRKSGGTHDLMLDEYWRVGNSFCKQCRACVSVHNEEN